MNAEVQLLSLDLTDYVVDNCNISLHSQIGSKEFLGKLISLLKTRDSPKVQIKILKLIKKWGEKFSSMKDIVPNFSLTYNNLKNSGIEFPTDTKNDYLVYIEDKIKSSYINNNNNNNLKSSSSNTGSNSFNDNKNQYNEKNIREKSQNFNNNNDYDGIIETEYVENDIVKLEPNDFKKKYRRFVEELNILIENINLANQMIDCSAVGKKPDESLRMIMLNLKGCEDNLLKAINGQISDELLLEICLKVNDDMNITTERYNLLKSSVKPLPFKSSFSSTSNYSKPKKNVHIQDKNYKEDNSLKQKNEIEAKPVSTDIFDIFSNNNNDTGNKNNNTQNNNTNYNNNNNDQKKSNQIDLNDIISSFSNTNLNNQQNTNTVPLFNFTDQKLNNNNSSNNSNKIDNLINNFESFNVHQSNNLNNQNFNNNMMNNQNSNNFNNVYNNVNHGNFPNNNNFVNDNRNYQGQFNNNYNDFNNNQGFNNNNFNQGQGLGYNMNNNLNMNNNMNMNYNMNNMKMNQNNNMPYINTNPNLAIGGVNDNFGKQIDSKDLFDLGLKSKKDKLEGINPFS